MHTKRQRAAVSIRADAIQQKVCRTCANEKPVTAFEFRGDKDRPHSRRNECDTCHRQGKRLRRDAKRGGVSKTYKTLMLQRELPDKPLRGFLLRTRTAKNAKNGGNLTPTWVMRWIDVTTCPITGLDFVLTKERVNGSPHPLSPSLDRIDPRKGYTDSNTRVVSFFANVAKNAWPEKQFKLLIQAAASNMRH